MNLSSYRPIVSLYDSIYLQIAAQQAAIATAAKLCAGNCNATNVAVAVSDISGVLRTLVW
jgi:hypothetical protein